MQKEATLQAKDFQDELELAKIEAENLKDVAKAAEQKSNELQSEKETAEEEIVRLKERMSTLEEALVRARTVKPPRRKGHHSFQMMRQKAISIIKSAAFAAKMRRKT